MSPKLLLVALLASAGAFGHSLEPSRLNVRVDGGHTEFPIFAVNRFDSPQTYTVSMWSDAEKTIPADATSYPETVTLAPLNGRARLWIKADNLNNKFLWVCTHTSPSGTGTRVLYETRVCMKATLYHKIGD